MKRLAWIFGILLMARSAAISQDPPAAKGETLNFNFEKGQQFMWTASHGLKLEFKELPEEFEALVGDEPIEITSSMIMEVTVEEVKEGVATMQGQFEKLSVKGDMVVQTLDFEYNAKDKPKEGESGEDEGAFGFDIESAFRKLVKDTLKFTVDTKGVIKLLGVEDQSRGGMTIARQFLTFNGFMGPLPDKPLALGETWKNPDEFSIPNLPITFSIEATNEVAEKKTVHEQECAVIKSKYTLGTAKKKGDEESSIPYGIEATLTGTGEGTTNFSLPQGKILDGTHTISANLDGTLQSPSTGEEVKIKATLSISLANEFVRLMTAERGEHSHDEHESERHEKE